MEEEDDDFEELKPMSYARWAISCKVGSEWVALIERTAATPGEVSKVMQGLELPMREVGRYFPKNKREEFCPTFELIHLFHFKLSARPKTKHKGATNV